MQKNYYLSKPLKGWLPILRTAYCLLPTVKLRTAFCLLAFFPLWGLGGLHAQTNIRYTSGTYSTNKQVSFEVYWGATPKRDVTDANGKRYNSEVWVLVDYQVSATSWIRAEISGTPTASSGSVRMEPGNNRGFWLKGTNGKFESKVTVMLSGTLPQKFNWCAYASDRPPVAKVNINQVGFSGTPPFTLNFSDGSSTVYSNKAGNTVTKKIVSLTDKTDCPSSDIQCIIAAPILRGGGSSYCNSTSLSITGVVGINYHLMRGNTAEGSVQTGPGTKSWTVSTAGTNNYTVVATNVVGGCVATSVAKSVQIIFPGTRDMAVTACGCSASNLTSIGGFCRNLAADNATACQACNLEVRKDQPNWKTGCGVAWKQITESQLRCLITNNCTTATGVQTNTYATGCSHSYMISLCDCNAGYLYYEKAPLRGEVNEVGSWNGWRIFRNCWHPNNYEYRPLCVR